MNKRTKNDLQRITQKTKDPATRSHKKTRLHWLFLLNIIFIGRLVMLSCTQSRLCLHSNQSLYNKGIHSPCYISLHFNIFIICMVVCGLSPIFRIYAGCYFCLCFTTGIIFMKRGRIEIKINLFYSTTCTCLPLLSCRWYFVFIRLCSYAIYQRI